MEGMLRQVSEFELASFKKNPEKFYSTLFGDSNLSALKSLGELGGRLREVQQSDLGQKIRQRALSGLPPLPEDVAEIQRQMQAVMSRHPAAQAQIEAQLPGLHKGGMELSLHKSWHCLHFLLTGKNWEPADSPLGNAIMGGAELPDKRQAMGYGPARYLTPSQVADVADALASFPVEERAEGFDPEFAAKQKVYVPNHEKEELLHYFGLLRDFYQDASCKGNAVILWVA